MEILIMLAVAYAFVAPDRATLSATRGVAGAASAARNRQPVIGGARQRARSARERRSTGRDIWSRTKQAGRGIRAGSRVSGRGLVRAARAARTGGGHVERGLTGGARLVGRAWRGIRENRAARRPGHDASENGPGATPAATPATDTPTNDPADTTPAGSTPTTTDPHTTMTDPTGPETAKKGTPMAEATITETELDGLDAVSREVETAIPMLEQLGEAVAQINEWAARLPERWAGTEWGTKALDEALGTAPEAAQGLGSTEQLMELMHAVQAALDEARALGEVAAEKGAYGTTTAFTPN